jgi:septum formation inhibitor-activating ATPase MinD
MTQRTIVVLVEGAADAQTVSHAIDARLGFGADDIVVVTAPDEIRGRAFWSSPSAPTWWHEHDLDAGETVLLIADIPRLAASLAGVTTRWFVWCRSGSATAAYAAMDSVAAVVAEDAASFADQVSARLMELGWRFGERPTWGPFRRASAEAGGHPAPIEARSRDAAPEPPPTVPQSWPPATARPPAAPEIVPPLPSLDWSAHAAAADFPIATASVEVSALAIGDPPSPAPLVDLANLPILAATGRPLATGRQGLTRRLATLLGGNGKNDSVDVGAIAQALVGAHDTVVLVGSRKGGVGKTTESLAVGFLAAQAVEVLGGSALVVDANLTNADITVKLRLPNEAPTVRDVVTALAANAKAPTPLAVRGSTLRVLGENRETQRYTGLEIEALVGDIRSGYTVAVVDLPNAVPGVEDKAEAAVEAWLPHADVVIIPIDTSIASFEGAADMLAAINELKQRRGDSYNPGVVIAFLRPSDIDPRRIAPDLAATLNELSELGAQVVDIPASSRMAMVDWSNHSTPLVDADPKVTRAYWNLVAAVTAARGVGG